MFRHHGGYMPPIGDPPPPPINLCKRLLFVDSLKECNRGASGLHIKAMDKLLSLH